MNAAQPLPLLLASLLAAACATTPAASPPLPAQPPVAQPLPAVDPDPLAPPAAAVRAAAAMRPTGLELGTMWTFENPPLAYWRERYDFSPTPAWLDHVRFASVRYAEHCSASFVSPDGLVMTNHHCARECIEAVSPPDTDYVAAGFHARTRAEERTCPDVFLDQLVGIDDVTTRMRAAAPAGATSEEIAQARQQEQQRIEAECGQRTGHQCQVVPLYQGGQYQLYTYRRFEPVKLVFSPELQAGYFGGDPDNFTYPRHALDVAFVRAWDADGTAAARTPEYFRWRPEGAAEGEAVFITGNPGSTSRLITLSQLMYERAYRHPFILSLLDGQRQLLQAMAAQAPEQERAVREQLFGVENSLKAFSGQLAGLRDTLLVAQKIAWEADFRRRVAASADAADFADVWDIMAGLQERKLALNPLVNLTNAALLGAPHLAIGAQLAGWLRAAGLPEAERPVAFQGPRFGQTRDALLQPTPIPEAQALPVLALQLGLMHEWMPPGHPLLALLRRAPGETNDDAARRIAAASPILDARFRRALIEGRAVADTVSDPLVRAAFMMDSIHERVLVEWRGLSAEETLQRQRLASALFAVDGTRQPPDATFTLRISDGVIAGYPYNGTVAPPHTTFHGMYGRAAGFGGRMPWTLPASFAEHRAALDLAVPLNFVSTNDITGGNSGSPMIDRDGRIVGIAFDGNIEQLPNEFLFRTEAGRTVAVHAAGILEALRSVYRAQALVDELLGQRR